MKINTQNNNISFKGRFYGFTKTVDTYVQHPQMPVNSCSYADRRMMHIVSNILISDQKIKDISAFVENDNGINYLSIILKRKKVKNNVPLFHRLTSGNYSASFGDNAFFEIIGNKKIQDIKYQISKNDIQRLIAKFTPTATLANFPLPLCNRKDKIIKHKIQAFAELITKIVPKENNNAKKLKKIFAPAYIK